MTLSNHAMDGSKQSVLRGVKNLFSKKNRSILIAEHESSHHCSHGEMAFPIIKLLQSSAYTNFGTILRTIRVAQSVWRFETLPVLIKKFWQCKSFENHCSSHDNAARAGNILAFDCRIPLDRFQTFV